MSGSKKYLKNKDRVRRSMLFLSAQRPKLLIGSEVYGADSLIFDLEDAVAESEKDAARYCLYHFLKNLSFGNSEKVVRINGLNTPHWQKDIFVSVASGADSIRIPMCESKDDVLKVQSVLEQAEQKYNRENEVLLMAAIETPLGVINSYDIASSTDRLFGIALSGGDLRNLLRVETTSTGVELNYSRGHIVVSARAAKVQCFDTVYTNLKDDEGFKRELELDFQMGFDGKSLIHPKQVKVVNDRYCPDYKKIQEAIELITAFKENEKAGNGVFTLNGKMVDKAFIPNAAFTLKMAKACGKYDGDLI